MSLRISLPFIHNTSTLLISIPAEYRFPIRSELINTLEQFFKINVINLIGIYSATGNQEIIYNHDSHHDTVEGGWLTGLLSYIRIVGIPDESIQEPTPSPLMSIEDIIPEGIGTRRIGSLGTNRRTTHQSPVNQGRSQETYENDWLSTLDHFIENGSGFETIINDLENILNSRRSGEISFNFVPLGTRGYPSRNWLNSVNSQNYSDLISHGNRETESQCVICLHNFTNNCQVTQVPTCQHTFHRDCLMSHINHTSRLEEPTCPTCRQVLSQAFAN